MLDITYNSMTRDRLHFSLVTAALYVCAAHSTDLLCQSKSGIQDPYSQEIFHFFLILQKLFLYPHCSKFLLVLLSLF